MAQEKPLPIHWQVAIVTTVVLCMIRHIAML